jgi:hypothetical protein
VSPEAEAVYCEAEKRDKGQTFRTAIEGYFVNINCETFSSGTEIIEFFNKSE